FMIPTSAVLCVAAASAAPILEIDNGRITAAWGVASSTSVQDIVVLNDGSQAGVNIDGTMRAGATLPVRINGNPFGSPWSGTTRIGDVSLHNGTYAPIEVDLALPAEVPWVIGRTYNHRQPGNPSGYRNSDGPQGKNWFQTSQPELIEGGSDVFLVYGADRYIVLDDAGTDVWKGVNGAGGVMQRVAGAGSEPDTYTYYDQHGTQLVFFGFDADSSPAEGQLWKIIATDGEESYVGDATTGSTAISNGYDGSGRITTAYDTTDRRYTYTYTSIDSVSRLTRVKAETRTGGTWASPTGLATVGQVDYAYYQTGDTTYGAGGNLKTVERTIPNTSGSDTVLQTYYRYHTSGNGNGLIKMVLGPEGTRNYDWTDQLFDDDHFSASDASLKPYSVAFLEYDSSRRIDTVFFNGECGCAGGSDGQHTFHYGDVTAYSNNVSAYDNDLATYTQVDYPGGDYRVQYFDEQGQPMTAFWMDDAPLGGSETGFWATHIERFAASGSPPVGGAVDRVLPPATNSIGGNNNPAALGDTWTFAVTAPDEKTYETATISSATNLGGLPTAFSTKEGTGGSQSTISSSERSLTALTRTIGAVTLLAPEVDDVTGRDGETTTLSQVYHSGDAQFRPKSVTTTLPSVQTSANGSGTADTRARYMRTDGSTAFTLSADGRYDYTLRENGLVTKTIRDAQTNHGSDFA
ncbi:MAG: hypothetical protein AAFY28_21195, partial [Actinomycetota bacterium]